MLEATETTAKLPYTDECETAARAADVLCGKAEISRNTISGPTNDVLRTLERMHRPVVESVAITVQARDAERWSRFIPYELVGMSVGRGYFEVVQNVDRLEQQGRIESGLASALRALIKDLAQRPIWDGSWRHKAKVMTLPERRMGTMID